MARIYHIRALELHYPMIQFLIKSALAHSLLVSPNKGAFQKSELAGRTMDGSFILSALCCNFDS